MRKVIKLSISICIVVTVLSCLVFAAQNPLLSKLPPEKKQTCKTKETKAQPGSDQLPIQVVQTLAGHADIKTTKKYYLAVRPEDFSSASKVLKHILSEAAAN